MLPKTSTNKWSPALIKLLRGKRTQDEFAQLLIWYTSGKHSRLSQRVLRVFDAAFADRALIVIPSAVFWEISLLIEHDKIKVREPFEVWAAALIARRGIDLAALALDVIAQA